MQVGDEVLQADGSWSTIESISVREGGAKVYNFEVIDNHNYFVGEQGTLVHNTCQKPGGYETHDVDRHGNLSPQVNRASGHTNTLADNQIQSHHFIQDKWAKENISGYSRNNAPAVLLPTGTGLPHTFITNAQEARRSLAEASGNGKWGGSNLWQEFQTSFAEMRAAGVPEEVIRKAAKRSYKYFDTLGAF